VASVTRPTTRPEPDPRSVDTPVRQPDRLTRVGDLIVDAAIALLATWTVVYHVCLIFRLGVPWAVAFEIVALAAWAGLWTRGQAPPRPDARRPAVVPDQSWVDRDDRRPLQRRLLVGSVALAAVAALMMAVSAPWVLVIVPWLLAALGAVVWTTLWLRDGAADRPEVDEELPSRLSARLTSSRVAFLWAGVLAVLSMFVRKPNPDDLYYVNLSQWVAEHGTYPLRDTIFSDLKYPMSSWPPMASYDGLVGTIARLAGSHAATVEYVFVPPLVTFLAVLALWRLLRAWRVTAVSTALTFSLVFLLFDGDSGYGSPGNLFVTRIWQGKVILLCVLVPVLLVYALRYVERPTRTNAAWMFVGGIAAVGLTTSAMFLVPILAAGGAAPLAVQRRWRAAAGGFAAMAAYPLACGVVTKAVGGHSADAFDARELYRFDPEWFGHEIFLQWGVAVVGVIAVLVGAFLIPRRSARVTTAVLGLALAVTLVPQVTDVSYDVVGLGPTLWRVSWVASIAALVGVLGASFLTDPLPRKLRIGGPLVIVALLVGFGVPITADRASVGWKWPWEWQRSPQSIAAADLVIDRLQPGDIVLAPQDLAITIDVTTTRIKTVAPRDYFMYYLRDDPGLHYRERIALVNFANLEPDLGETYDPAEVAKALDVVAVDEVCLPRPAPRRVMFLRDHGYSPVTSTATYSCLTR
jgi:hypothetical protein